MSTRVRWVTETAALTAALSEVGDGPLALDSEADSFHHYREKVCLIQLSFRDRDLLIDPLAGVDPSVLGPLLGERGLTKILHGADYDLRLLRRDFGLEVRGLYDTMIAARLLGERAFGLAALLEKYVGVKLDKRFQRADWSERPLSPEMQEYAVLDTRHLETLAGKLRAELARLGRAEWAREEFERLESVRFNEQTRSVAPYLRIKGSKQLERRSLAVLRSLADLREAEARQRDVPPFRVLRDEVLVELANAAPRAAPELRKAQALKTKGLPHGFSRGAELARLMEAIDRALSLPEAEWPEPAERVERRRNDPAYERRLAKLATARNRLAESLGLEPAVLASRQALEQVLAAFERGQGLDGAEGLRRWQVDALRPLAADPSSAGASRAYH